MEDKLQSYRRQQQRKQFFENIKIRLRNMISPPQKDVVLEVEKEKENSCLDEDSDQVTRMQLIL